MLTEPQPETISIFAASPEAGKFDAEVVVTLPTFKRPEHLLATLSSLKVQNTKRQFAVIVMENDAGGQAGAAAAKPVFEGGELNGYVIIAHQRGNCHAYNAGWLTAMQRFRSFRQLIVIDDDELADQDWLENHVKAAELYGADIVGGPQVPVFEDPGLQKWEKHPVFRPPYTRSGVVDTLYSSGNLSLRKSVLETMPFPYLDPKFNFMGGGDADFLSRCAQAGFTLAWCAETVVRETMPSRRTEPDWIRTRGLRNGVISTLVEKKRRSGELFGGLRTLAKSAALLLASPLRAGAALLQGNSLTVASYPVLVGLGRVMGEFGYINEQYRNAEEN